MREAVIVSTARTPIGRAYRGAFNDTQAQALAGRVVAEAVRRAGVDPGEVEDVVLGAALQQGSSGYNVARQAALRAGLPVSVAGMTIDRQCASGLMAIATAAKQIIIDHMDMIVAGGVESISLVQTPELRISQDPALVAMHGDMYLPMLQTAEVVTKRYGITRERQDAYALRSQQRTAAAQERGAFDDEIVPVEANMLFTDKALGETRERTVTLSKDEGNRPKTRIEDLAALQPVLENGAVTAGNASQLSDGASACVVMDGDLAKDRGLKPLGRYMGFAVAGTKPDEMGIGPVIAVPKLLKRFDLKIKDIDLWELNEAFATQVLYCQ